MFLALLDAKKDLYDYNNFSLQSVKCFSADFQA
jgi:hypothetical protein